MLHTILAQTHGTFFDNSPAIERAVAARSFVVRPGSRGRVTQNPPARLDAVNPRYFAVLRKEPCDRSATARSKPHTPRNPRRNLRRIHELRAEPFRD